MLYHLSFDVLDTIEEFIPRIPDNRMVGEDNSSLRVCCASTIEGAVLAMPNNKDFIGSTILFPLIKVYELDEENVVGNLIMPDVVQNEVSDAIKTGEHWITTTIKPSNVYIIQVTSMNYDKNLENIKELKYKKLTNGEEADIGEYYSFNIAIKASDETLMILNEEIINDVIYSIGDLLSKADSIIRDIIYFVSAEPDFHSADINSGFELYVDGYFEGEYRTFVHQKKEVINEIKKRLNTLISQYKLKVEFI